MTIATGSVDRLRRPALMAACPALCASLGCQPDIDPGGLSEGHAAAIRDNMSSALDAFRELGSGPDPTAVGRFYSKSPAFRFYENGAPRYESAPDLRATLRGLGPAMRITQGHPEPVGVRHVLVRAHETGHSGLQVVRIPAENRLKYYRTAQSVFSTVVLYPAGPCRESGKTEPEWRDSRPR